MTALDRALIKAYRSQHGGSVAAVAPLPAAPDVQEDAITPETALRLHAAEAQLAGPHFRRYKKAGDLASDMVVRLDALPEITFRVDVGIADTPAPLPVDNENSAAEIQESPVPVAAVEPTARPAVHAADGGHVSVPVQNPASEDKVVAQPQLVVDRFGWSDVCDELHDQMVRSWATIAESFAVELAARKTIALVGLDVGAGCTTTALCLARVAACRGRRTLLVDADFARPRIANELSLKIEHGWDAAAAARMPLGDVLIESLDDQLVLAPLAGPPPAHLIQDRLPRVEQIWKALGEAYELFVVDGGSIHGEVAASPLKSFCKLAAADGVFLVCDARSTPPQEVIRVSGECKEAGIELLGVIENFAGSS